LSKSQNLALPKTFDLLRLGSDGFIIIHYFAEWGKSDYYF